MVQLPKRAERDFKASNIWSVCLACNSLPLIFKRNFGEACVSRVLVVSSKASDFLPVFKQINSIMLV